MAPWIRWGAILTCFACAATIVVALPTIGMYSGHVAAIWHAPEQLQRVGILESNQAIQSVKIQSMEQNIADIHQDVREIHTLFFKRSETATTNLIAK